MRSIASIVVGIVVGVVAASVVSDRVQARMQGQKEDKTRLQAAQTTFFAGPNLRFRFVVDTKTKACYMVSESSERGVVTAVVVAPTAACE